MNSNRAKILNILKDSGQTSPKDLQEQLKISSVMLFRHLKKLQAENKITKIGSSPRVFYTLDNEITPDENSTKLQNKIVEDNFSLITATGQEIIGIKGFAKWCADRKLNVEDMLVKYEEQYNSYKKFFTGGYIDATQKIVTSFGKTNSLDKLFYLDFYSYPVFGRTKISNWLFYGKTLQQLDLINRVIEAEKNKIYSFILEQNIDAVLFVPPTVPRKIQFMKVLEESLNLNLPKIKIIKVKTQIAIQQKSLKDLRERIQNAETSLVVETKGTGYKKLLIMDDFTGSGATLNTIAEKCKRQKIADTIIGLTITGSINGFEVVREI